MRAVSSLAACMTLLASCGSGDDRQKSYNAMSCGELAYHKGMHDAKLGSARSKSLGGALTSALGGEEVQTYGQTQAIVGGIEEDRAIETLDKIQIAQALKRC